MEKEKKVLATPEDPVEKIEQHEEKMSKMNPWVRFGLLKRKIRDVILEKDEAGYKAQYFYISLQNMQAVFSKIETEYLITTVYSEETEPYYYEGGVVFKNFCVRKAIDVLTGNEIAETRLDITNLKQITDPYELKQTVLDIAEPRDAWKTLFLDYFEPQMIGSISTYFQRYTYNQLYDFQETKEDSIEKKGKLQGNLEKKETKSKESKNKEPEVQKPSSSKIQRLNDESAELRTLIKKEFEKPDIIKQLNGRKLGSMSKEETTSFYEEMVTNHTKKENKGE